MSPAPAHFINTSRSAPSDWAALQASAERHHGRRGLDIAASQQRRLAARFLGEWVWYTNSEQLRLLKLRRQTVSLTTGAALLRQSIQRHDEHALLEPGREDFRGYEEPHHISEVLECANPYLPDWGAMGEMVLNVGKSIYLARKGVDGIVDVSPFTCMNGIVCEAIYPRVSRDNADIPIRNFYFDGTQSDLDRDIGIYLELVRTYSARKPHPRVFPSYFPAV